MGGPPDFGDLWRQQYRKLLAHCLHWTGGRRDLAEEALARSGALALEKYPEHAAELRHPGAWLQRITYHVCVDLHREIKRRSEESLDELEESSGSPTVSSSADPERIFLYRERKRVLRAGVAGLPTRLRLPLELHLYRDLSYREIADELAITEANVRKRMQHAREALRDRMERYRSGVLDAEALAFPSQKRQVSKRGPDRASNADAARAPDREVRAFSESAPAESPPSESDGLPRAVPALAVRDFRAVRLRRPDGTEKDCVLVLREPVRRATRRRFESLESYIRDHPGGWKRRRDLARLLRQEGRWCEAIGHYRFVLDKHSRQAWLWGELGQMLEAMGRVDAALEAFGHARQRSRDKAERRRWRAAMLAAGGDLPEATEALRDALFVSPESPLLHLELGRLLLRSSRYAEADEAFQEVLERLPDDPEALVSSHDARFAIGRRDEAVARVRRAVEHRSESFPALARWLAHQALGRIPADPDEVYRHRRTLWQLASGWAEARYAEALQVEVACRRNGEEEGRGIRAMRTWLETRHHHPRGHLLLAHLLEAMGHPREAAATRQRGGGVDASDRDLVWP